MNKPITATGSLDESVFDGMVEEASVVPWGISVLCEEDTEDEMFNGCI